jgi:ABC-type microcin C transport system permease subunit YejB
MFAYLIKRLLLLIPTLIGVVTLAFVVVQFVPGGPVEQMMMEMKGRGGGSEASGGGGVEYRAGVASTRRKSRRSARCTASTRGRPSATS